MKKYLLTSIRLTVVMIVLLGVIYPLIVSFAGRFCKGNGGGEKVIKDGKVVGYALLGQSFTKPQYFWGRPSAAGYNAAGSAGSNKGPSNPDYLKDVASRIDTLLKYHPYAKRADIPADLVTASGSGLDPNISVEGARLQITRVAGYRKLDEKQVADLVEKNTNKTLLGPSSVNLLQLNLALDEISARR